MKFETYTVRDDSTVREAFEQIDRNRLGTVIVLDKANVVIGVATDGDIRRHLIQDPDIEKLITTCMNQDFRFASVGDHRENILKRLDLDRSIKMIPVLDSEKKIVDIVTINQFPLKQKGKILARAKSPVRISFGGGGSDLTHYFKDKGGVVLNATTRIYSHATLRKRDDEKITIYSADLCEEVLVDKLDELVKHDNFKLIHSAIKLIDPGFGFDLTIHSDFPMGSGLGGSAVVLSAIIGCFNEFREDKWDDYEIAELAFQAERISLKMSGGWQDQYATVFGGFNFMEFTNEQNVIHPLRLSRKTLLELEENLVLCYSNHTHNSGSIHDEQKKNYESDKNVKDLVKENMDVTYQMKNHLLKGRLDEVGKLLDTAWRLKKSFCSGISNSYLDSIYETATANGALGGKLMGAGGGGYFLFYVRPFERAKLVKKLTEMDLNCEPLHFDFDGLQSWTIRE